MRRNAEKAMRPGRECRRRSSPSSATEQPTTGNGCARLAEAHAANGRQAEALAAAREAWASGDLSATDEQLIYARYRRAASPRADHDRRADALLFAKKAERRLPLPAPGQPAPRRGVQRARSRCRRRSPDAEARYQPVIGQVTSDAGLMMDRARYLRDSGYRAGRPAAVRPAAQFHPPPGRSRALLEMMLLLAQRRGARPAVAHRLRHRPPGRRRLPRRAPTSACKPLGIRDEYTSLTWLAGTGGARRARPARATRSACSTDMRAAAARCRSRPRACTGPAAPRSPAGRAADAGALFPARRRISGTVLRPAGARAARPLGDRPADRRRRP